MRKSIKVAPFLLLLAMPAFSKSHGVATNFSRVTAEIIPSTIRTADDRGSGPLGVASVIARITPADSTDNRIRPLKLYAVKGTTFYTDLLAAAGRTGDAPSYEILGIFTLDPFSIKNLTEGNPADGAWTSVSHPLSLLVFGEM